MKAYKYRFFPTTEQAELLAKSFGCVRYVYNSILDWRSKEYTQNGNKINYSASSKRLTELKKETEWLKEVSSVVLQQALRNQDAAFANFFAKRAKYPNFKSKHQKQSIRLVSSGFRLVDGKLYIAKSKEPLNIKWSRELKGKISSITISKDCSGRYFVSMLSDFEPEKLPVIDKAIGIDWGLTDFITTSDGYKYKPLKSTKKYAKKLAKTQRHLAKKVKGSHNRNKARLKVAKVHAKIADSRHDFLHKLSTKLIRENQVISIEDIALSNLVKNRKLSKSISDSGWNTFVNQLNYKAEMYGRTISKISRWFPSSQICSECGHRGSKKPLDVRRWKCAECHSILDRDINAAININTAGLAEINACGVEGSEVLKYLKPSETMLKQESPPL